MTRHSDNTEHYFLNGFEVFIFETLGQFWQLDVYTGENALETTILLSSKVNTKEEAEKLLNFYTENTCLRVDN